MDNKILQAWQESLESFEKEFGYRFDFTEIDPENITGDKLASDVKSFLTAHSAKLLKACLEAGPREEKYHYDACPCMTCRWNSSHNACRSAFHAPILEVIKEMEGKV